MAVLATIASNIMNVESTTGAGVATDNDSIQHGYSDTVQLNATSTPDAESCATFEQALTAGVATIDLTALTGKFGTVSGSGKKVRAIKFRGKSTNTAVITAIKGATNGYELGTAAWKVAVFPGTWVCMYFKDALGAIGGAAKTIDLAGTGVEIVEFCVVFG